MHIYEQDGVLYPSVTTILTCLGNDAIIKWANHLGFMHKDYQTTLDESADFGTKVHDTLRSVIDPDYHSTIEFKNEMEMLDVMKIEQRFRKFISNYTYETIFTEKTIISPTLGYAGTLDWLAKMNGKFLMLNDFKTSKAVRFKMMLQLGGYGNLLRTELGIDVDGASIILANRKLCTMYPISKAEVIWYGQAFDQLAKYYRMVENKTMEADKDLLSKLTNP